MTVELKFEPETTLPLEQYNLKKSQPGSFKVILVSRKHYFLGQEPLRTVWKPLIICHLKGSFLNRI